MRLKRLFWILILFAELGILLAVGVAIPQFVVSDGLDQFRGKEQAVAQDALISARIGCLDNPIMRGLIRKIRVVEVKSAPGRCPTVDPFFAYRDYRAVLRAYTFFGIPTGTISVCGGEVVCSG